MKKIILTSPFLVFLFSFGFVFAQSGGPVFTLSPLPRASFLTGDSVPVSWTVQNPSGGRVVYLVLANSGGVRVPGIPARPFARTTLLASDSASFTLPQNLPNNTSYRFIVYFNPIPGTTGARVVKVTDTFTVTGQPTVEFLNPPADMVFQKGNTYQFSFQWRNMDGARKWAFASTRVMEGANTAQDGLENTFRLLFQNFFNVPRTDGKDGPVDFDFTVPSDYSSQGLRRFFITFLPYDELGEPQTDDKKIPIDRTFKFTSVKGDIDGNGCVGLTDLLPVAQFIARGLDGPIQKRDYFNDFLKYNIDGIGNVGEGGIVDNDDLIIQARNFNQPRCATN